MQLFWCGICSSHTSCIMQAQMPSHASLQHTTCDLCHQHSGRIICQLHAVAHSRIVGGSGATRDLALLQRIMVAREGRRLGTLMRAMAAGKGSQAVFEIWMLQQSDAVQACALAYAEREVLDASVRAISQVLGPRLLL